MIIVTMTSIISLGTQCRFEYDSEHPFDSFDYDEEEYTESPWLYYDPAKETCGDYSYNDGDYSPDSPSDYEKPARVSLLHSAPIISPPLIQLPPDGSKFNTMKEHVADVVLRVSIEFKNKATLKLLAEEAVAERHSRFMAKLPKEPTKTTHRRRFRLVLTEFKMHKKTIKDAHDIALEAAVAHCDETDFVPRLCELVNTRAAVVIQNVYREKKGWFRFRTHMLYKKKNRREWLDRCDKKNKSSNVWGHRRNGGGKGKKEEASAITEADKKEAAERRTLRRMNATVRKEEEERKKKEHLQEVEYRIAQYKASVESEPEPEPEVVEETPIQKLSREKMEYMREIVQKKLFDQEKAQQEELEMKRQREEEMEELSCIAKGYKKEKTKSPVFPSHTTTKSVKFTSTKNNGDWQEVGKSMKVLDLSNILATTSTVEMRRISQEARLSVKKVKKSTRMCKFILANEPCRHGAKCRFAHDISELQIACCKTGDDCRFVKRSNGRFVNRSRFSKCLFRHDGESDDAFYIRNGYKDAPSVTKPVICKPVASAPVPVTNPWKVEEVKKPRASRWGPPLDEVKSEKEVKKPRASRWGPPLDEVKKPRASRWGPPLNEDRVTIIRAPKAIIMKLYTIAINAGRKNIQIIISD